jgi:hypothetical protein
VTVSISLQILWKFLERISCKSPDKRMRVPNWPVAASSLAAMFTFGERYEASILKKEPIAPSIAQP